MILHQNSIIKLEYNPAFDILEVKYPDLQNFILSEIKDNLRLMVEAIRNYDVKRLLLDASSTTVEISDDENRKISLQLAIELGRTRIQKVARIQPMNPSTEARAQENIKQMEKQGILHFQLRTFSDKTAAISWLRS